MESTGSGRRYDYLYNLKGQVLEMTEYEKDENGNYVPLIGHIYEYDDRDRLDLRQSIFEYTVGESTGQTDVTYHYEYADSPDEDGFIDTDNVGELTEFSVSGADYHDSAAITYTYDDLYRPATKTLEASGGLTIGTEYEYKTNNTRTTMQVSKYTSVVTTPSKTLTTAYEYTYSTENITSIVDSNGNRTRYVYDDLDQLIREDNQALGKSYVYTYDNGGNRTSKTTYAYTTGTLGTATATQTLTYSMSEWGDQLTGTTYDAIGNPLTYNGYDMTWEGRQLMEMSMNAGQIKYTFEYNSDGIRTAKYSNGTWHYYTLEGSRIVSETWGSRMLVYLYDESGAPIGLQYRQNSYENYDFDTFYFEKNLFGDIVAIYNEDGDKIGSYTYDAWGNFTVSTESGITVTERSIVRTYNPFRYRGYFYDTDTGLYYLQSRYYNPQWGRFLNADGSVNANGDMIGFNMYAYCSNNPVMNVDPTGESDIAIILAGLFLYYTADSECLPIQLLADCVRVGVYGKDNTNAEVVASAHWFSYYDDALVIQNPIKGINSFSIGNTIFLGEYFDRRSIEDQTLTLKHEHGHVQQEQDLGGIKYFASVAVPSVLYCGFSRVMNRGFGITYFSDIYDSMPWEYKANENSDIVGNVQPWAKDVSDSYFAFWGGGK